LTSVLFIRHAQPDHTISKEIERPLTKKGVADSKELISKYGNLKIDIVYSSPYLRSIETIKPLAISKGLEVIINDDLRERRTNIWYTSNIEFMEYAKRQWDNFSYKNDGGESIKEVQERNIRAISNILSQNNGKTILIGTHGTALSTIVNYYDSSKKYEWFEYIVGKMPFSLIMKFEKSKYLGMEEI